MKYNAERVFEKYDIDYDSKSKTISAAKPYELLCFMEDFHLNNPHKDPSFILDYSSPDEMIADLNRILYKRGMERFDIAKIVFEDD